MRALTIGIAGGSGSGKSTVARKVAEAVRGASVAFIEMDAYYRDHAHLSMDERRKLNWDHPDRLDLELFVEHVARLRRGEHIARPIYDFVAHARTAETVAVPAADVVVVDGILLLVEERIRALLDIKVYVDTDADVRLVRRVRRDMAKRGRPLPEILDQYMTSVRPMHLQFVEPSKRYADVIVPEGGHNPVAVDLLVAQINGRLNGRRP
jgi:uridine kinase